MERKKKETLESARSAMDSEQESFIFIGDSQPISAEILLAAESSLNYLIADASANVSATASSRSFE
jgi:hypothetical protein